MELDDLKQQWKENKLKTQNTNIMELIQHKSYGPVAALKREFKKQMRLMAIIPLLLIVTNANDLSKVFTSLLFWAYVIFCAGMVAFGWASYAIAAKMENMETNVRSNLEQQVGALETSLKWKQVALRVALLFFILLTEVTPYFQHYRMLDKWHSLPAAARFGTYAGLLILQYFLSKAVNQRKFGTHLDYLKKLLKEMQ